MSDPKQGFRCLMAFTLVKDHRIDASTPNAGSRHYAIGETFTLEDLEDRDRYPAPPNVWHWVIARIVEPVGWDEYTLVEPLTDTDPRGRNPNGYLRPGAIVTKWHFPDHVDISALLATGHLEPRTEPANNQPEG